MLPQLRRFRAAYLASNALCARCRAQGKLEIATAVRSTVVIGNPSLLFRTDLCEPVCTSHHKGLGWREAPAPTPTLN